MSRPASCSEAPSRAEVAPPCPVLQHLQPTAPVWCERSAPQHWLSAPQGVWNPGKGARELSPSLGDSV